MGIAGLSDSDIIAIGTGVGLLIVGVLQAILGTRPRRIGYLRRRDILSSLESSNPTFKSFRKEVLNQLPDRYAAWYLAAAPATFGPLLLGKVLGTTTYFAAGPLLSMGMLAGSTVGYVYYLRLVKDEANETKLGSPVPSELLRAFRAVASGLFLVRLATIVGVAVFIAAFPGVFTNIPNGLVGVEVLGFGVFFAVQDLERITYAEQHLFDVYLERTGKQVRVIVYLESGEGGSSAVWGTVTGVGPKLRVDRTDGYVERIDWTSISRIATEGGPRSLWVKDKETSKSTQGTQGQTG